jgi:hypothetical protein
MILNIAKENRSYYSHTAQHKHVYKMPTHAILHAKESKTENYKNQERRKNIEIQND